MTDSQFEEAEQPMIKFGRFIAKHRVLILILAVLLLIPSVLGYISTRVNYDVLTYLPDDIDTMVGQDILMDEFGKGGFSMVVLQGMDDKNVSQLREKISKVDEAPTKRVELHLHSDQGFQYTSQAYFNLTQEYGITPSMSRRGTPYDNAMAENFFSILKTECIYRHKPATFSEANEMIDRYIHFYNHERIQLKTGEAPLARRLSA